MDEQRIEIGDCPLLPVIFGQGIMGCIGLVERRVEAAEERGHGEVDTAMAVMNGRVDEDGPALVVAEEIAGRRRLAPAEGQTQNVCRRRAGGSGSKIAGSTW